MHQEITEGFYHIELLEFNVLFAIEQREMQY